MEAKAEEADKVEDLEFEWGKKRGVGGKKKEVQFYDSFTYDGLEYFLHDCVYLYTEGEPEPYIGKIIKIWQNPDKSKKVKVLWFFHPHEILTWFNDEETPDNELFLACGEGVGLANVNPLEAIAGKCNVVCISKDNRNPQPSEEELQMAEFVFYRTFDVGRHTVSDKIDDKIAGVDVKFMFNRIESPNPSGFLKLDSDKKENFGNAVPTNETLMTGGELGTGIEVKITSKSKYDADEGEGNSCRVISNQVEGGDKVKAKASGDLDTRPSKKAKVDSFIKPSEDKNSKIIQNSSIEKITLEQENALEDCTTPKTKIDLDKGEGNVGEKVKAVKASVDLDSRPSKKAKVDSSINFSEDKNRKNSSKQENALEDITTSKSKIDSDKAESNVGEKVNAKKVSDDLELSSSKKAKVDCPIKSSEDKNRNVIQKSSIDSDKVNVKAGPIINVSEDRKKSKKKGKVGSSINFSEDKNRKNSSNEKITVEQENALEDINTPKSKIDSDKGEGNVGEKLKAKKVSDDLEPSSSKKAKVNCPIKSSEDKNRNVIQKSSIDSDKVNVKAGPIINVSEDRTKSKLAKDSRGMDDNLSKKLKSEEKMPELSNGKLLKGLNVGSPETDTKIKLKFDENKPELSNGKLVKASNIQSPEKDGNANFQVMEVTRRPDADRSRWFKGRPWEERMQSAYKQETLVLLENLDPAYTSSEVEDIVWHGFKESCTAKMIQRTGISSPHTGQAFVIFKTKEGAEKAVKKLRQGCLMLSEGRPIVGSFGTPCPPKKESTLVGHLAIDKPKIQMQREMQKEAVSTSHCSQPNTIEYEMAMEWCLLQDRSESLWEKLYKQQGDDIRKVKAALKLK